MAERTRLHAATKESVAYDYSRLEKNQAQELPQMDVHKGKSRARVPYGKYTVIAGSIFAVLCVILLSYAQVTVLTSQNTKIKAELAQLASDENSLNARKEQIFNLAYVEDRAKNTLGMVKLDKTQLSYVDLSQADSVVIDEDGANTPALIAGIAKTFDAAVEYLK